MRGNYNYRFGGFAFPFLAGALVGGGSAVLFNPYRPRPVYQYPIYGPYYPYY